MHSVRFASTRHQNLLITFLVRVSLLAFGFVFSIASCWAQNSLLPQQSNSPASSLGSGSADDPGRTEAAAANDNESTPNEPVPDSLAAGSGQFQVSRIGSSGWLTPNVHSPVHLGPFYVPAISVMYMAGNQLELAQAANEPSTVNLAVLETTVVFDKVFQKERLTFQYQPELALLNGHLESNFSNQNGSFSISRALTPRLSIGVSDSLSYINGNMLYGGANLDVNASSGVGYQNPFLQNSSEWLNNNTTMTIGYRLSAVDQLTIAPYYLYQHTTGDISTPDNSYDYGGKVTWSRALDAKKSIGLYGGIDHRQFSAFQPGANLPATLYEDFGVGYSQHFTETWVASINFGLGTSTGQLYERNQFGSTTQNGTFWTETGTASLRKDFKHSSLSVAYYRGMSLGPILTNGYTNMVNGMYSRTLGSRLQITAGVGYESDYGYSTLSALSGTYLMAQVGYRLARNLEWVAGYSKRWETQTALPTLNSNFFSTGLTWTLAPSSNVISPTF